MRAHTILLLLLLPLLAAAANDVIIADLKIFVNNYEYIVKGISYNPAPLGIVDEYVSSALGCCLLPPVSRSHQAPVCAPCASPPTASTRAPASIGPSLIILNLRPAFPPLAFCVFVCSRPRAPRFSVIALLFA